MTDIICIMVSTEDPKVTGELITRAMREAGADSAAVHVVDLEGRPALRAAAVDIWGFEAVMTVLKSERVGMAVPSGCGHPQTPPTRAEIEDTEVAITRTCPTCRRALWWHINQWSAL